MSAPVLRTHPVAARWRVSGWTGTKRDRHFWFSFVALNVILFLPYYLLDFQATSFLPSLRSFPSRPAQILFGFFVWRENADAFRLSAEMVLLAALWANVPRLRCTAFRTLASFTYTAILAYHIYEAITVTIYRVEPAFYSQYFLARDGIGFLLRHLNLSTPLLILGAGAAGAAILGMVKTIQGLLKGAFNSDELSKASQVALAAVASVLAVLAIPAHSAFAQPESVISSIALKLRANVSESLKLYHEVHAFDEESFRRAYELDSLQLDQKPNVYLIFIESYGSVLYRRPDYESAYTALLRKLQSDLNAGGWHVASALSESTTWGGGSWLAYSSALFGMPIESHPQYLALLERFGKAEEQYPSLPRLLMNQGYQTIWISSIAEEINDSLWREYHNFYGIDQWLRHSDLDYDGAQYGWGPAPPDQYVLEYVRDTFVASSHKPTFLFFITQNSHFPWQTPPLVENWRALLELDEGESDTETSDEVPHQELRMAYLNAIEYELSFLTKSVVDTAEEDAIFVLIGDHQPPRVSRRNDSFDTPVHIITRNQRVIQALRTSGFEDGLIVTSEPPAMKHEGLYSLLRNLLATGYGVQDAPVPDYLPDGVPSVVDAPAEAG